MKRYFIVILVVAITFLNCESYTNRKKCKSVISTHKTELQSLHFKLTRLKSKWPEASWDDLKARISTEIFAPEWLSERSDFGFRYFDEPPASINSPDKDAEPYWGYFYPYIASSIEPKIIISGPSKNTCWISYDRPLTFLTEKTYWREDQIRVSAPSFFESPELLSALAYTMGTDYGLPEYPDDPELFARNLKQDLKAKYIVISRLVDLNYPEPPKWTNRKPSIIDRFTNTFDEDHLNVELHVCVFDLESEKLIARFNDSIYPGGSINWQWTKWGGQNQLDHSFYEGCKESISRKAKEEQLSGIVYKLGKNVVDPEGIVPKDK